MEKHGGCRGSYAWLAVAWAQQKSYVQYELNRADGAGCDVPSGRTQVLWVLVAERPGVHPWHHHWRLLLVGLLAQLSTTGDDTTPEVDTISMHTTYRRMNARRSGFMQHDVIDMVDWMVEQGLVQSPQMSEEGAAAGQDEPDEPDGRVCEEGKEDRPRAAVAPQRRRVRLRKIPFAVENPSCTLHRQLRFRRYDRYMSKTDLCRWSGCTRKKCARGTRMAASI